MIRLRNGPAAGEVLWLLRAPLFLRVTVCGLVGAEVDALDQLDDRPGRYEAIHVYRRQGAAGSIHVDFTRRRSAWYASAVYVYHDTQPDDGTARDTAKWREWCWAQVRGVPAPAPQTS